MQGQKGGIGSLPESLAMEHGSASSDSRVVEEQICWTNFMRTTPANNSSDLYLNSTNHESQPVNMWSMGESSSSTLPIQLSQNRVDPKTEHGSIGHLSGPLFMQTSRPESVPHNATVNPSTFIGIKPSNYASSSSSDPFDLENRHLPCKRKATELSIGQSSSGIESSSIFQRPEGSTSVWRSFSENSSANSIPSDPTNPRLGLAVGGVSSDNRSLENSRRNVENSRRNVRIRINSSRQQDSLPAINNSNNNNFNNGQINFSSPYPSLGLNPVATTDDNSSSHESQPVSRVPTLRRNLQLSSRSRSSSSRANRSVPLNIGSSGDNLRTMPTNISDHPLFIQPPTINWSLNSSNVTNIGNGNIVASTMNPMPNLGSHRGSSHYPSRRLSEILRRSLLSSVDSGTAAAAGGGGVGGGQTSNLFSRIPPPVGSSASSSQEVGILPVIGMPGPHLHRHHRLQHHLVQLRSSDTQLDGAFGFPYMARPVAGGSERRGRLVSEIRNVLDLIRRGEGLRFEDVMLLDQSMLYGMADIHDRHRDMRLDIDNMSYEELLALEERIGNVNTGLTEENISSCMKLKTYVTMTGQPDAEPCCICQEEYKNGDDLGGLKCGHDFHTNCIKKWLLQKNACPVCKSAATKAKDEA